MPVTFDRGNTCKIKHLQRNLLERHLQRKLLEKHLQSNLLKRLSVV